MGVDLLVEQIEETNIPYVGSPISHHEKSEDEIKLRFGGEEELAENMFNLCDSIEAAFQKNNITFKLSKDKAGHYTEFNRLDCWPSYPHELYFGGRIEGTIEKAACSAKLVDEKYIQIKIEDEDASVAGYTAKELFDAIDACIRRLKK